MKTLPRVLMTTSLLFVVSLPAFALKVTLQGQVTGPDDHPVPDARIVVVYLAPDFAQTRTWAIARPACDAAGRFLADLEVAAPETAVQVLVRRDGLAAAWGQVVAKAMKPLALKLGGDPVSCQGVVTETDGKPIKTAEVRVFSVGKPATDTTSEPPISLPREEALTASTDGEGHFKLAGFAAGTQLGLYVTAEGHEYRYERPVLQAAAPPLRVTLNPEAVIKGRVVQNARSVAGTRVMCCQAPNAGGTRGYAESDAAGRYELHHLGPGTYTVSLADDVTKLAWVARPVVGLAVQSGETVAAGDLVLTPGAVISGTVKDGAGHDLDRVSIYANSDDYPGLVPGTAWQTRTDANGAYRVRVLPGKVRVRCRDQNRTAKPTDHTVAVTEGQVLELQDFTLTAAEVRGVVFLPGGQPAPGVPVRVMNYGHENEEPPTAQTDAEGAFTLPVQPGGGDNVPPLLVAQDAGNHLAAAAFAESGVPMTMLHLTPGGTVLTQAVDEQGQPVRGICLTAYTDRQNRLLTVMQAQSDDRGMVSLGPLPVGMKLGISVGYKHRDAVIDRDWRYTQEMTLTEGESRSLPPLRLNVRGRSVRGVIRDETGQPVASALIFGTGAAKPASADQAGEYSLSGLAARANVWLTAIHPSLPLAALTVLDPDKIQTQDFTLRPLASAKVRVVDVNGQPVRAEVGVWPDHPNTTAYNDFEMPWQLSERLHGWHAVCDEGGIWTVATLISGIRYMVHAQTPDMQLGTRTFEVKAGETPQVIALQVKPRQ